MSLFAVLAKEHLLFKRLVDRLERALSYDPRTAKSEIRETLLVLFPALERHEELEDLLFAPRGRPRSSAAKKAATRVEVQHRRIAALRADAAERLAMAEDATAGDLPAVILPLVKRLREHFRTEETVLWPHYEGSSRSLTRGLERRAAARVKELESEVRRSQRTIRDYLEGL